VGAQTAWISDQGSLWDSSCHLQCIPNWSAGYY